MLRRVLLSLAASAVAFGAVVAAAPAASAEDICAFVGITQPVNRPPLGDCATAYPGDTACVTHMQAVDPIIGVVVAACFPWTHRDLPTAP